MNINHNTKNDNFRHNYFQKENFDQNILNFRINTGLSRVIQEENQLLGCLESR